MFEGVQASDVELLLLLLLLERGSFSETSACQGVVSSFRVAFWLSLMEFLLGFHPSEIEVPPEYDAKSFMTRQHQDCSVFLA